MAEPPLSLRRRCLEEYERGRVRVMDNDDPSKVTDSVNAASRNKERSIRLFLEQPR